MGDDVPTGSLRDQWALDPRITYLNHGSFGPSPREVIAARHRWIERLESNPLDFFVRQLDGHLRAARERLGAFIGAAAEDLVLVENATAGMNIVAASVALAEGDEVLLTDHEYGAVVRIWERACRRAGARLVTAELPFPISSADEVVDAIAAAVTERTRLAVVSHVTSPTAVILPVEAVCRRLRAAGVSLCIDGPHAPAMVPVDLARLECDYYTASCHKWLCAPFGSGFLYAASGVRPSLEPVMLSWGRMPSTPDDVLDDEFGWPGTRDPSAYLATGTAIKFMERFGLDEFRRRTHALAEHARRRIIEQHGLRPLVLDEPDWYGSMVALELPALDPLALQQGLWEGSRIEVPIFTWRDRPWIRVSCHLYNTENDVERLVEALGPLLPSRRPA